MAIPDDFLAAIIRGATPIALAALGELIVERSGVINIGIEGAVSVGAVVATLVAYAAGPTAGLLAGTAAGGALAALFGIFVTRVRTEQIITGTAISMLGLGISATLHRALLASDLSRTHVSTLPAIAIPGLSELPLIGGALFTQPLPTYLLYVCLVVAAVVLHRTVAGLVLRATGEDPHATEGVGRNPASVQLVAIVTGGALAGLSGATLVVAQAGVFSDGISAGRGFIAIAVVALGGWSLLGVVGGSVLFGAVSAMQFIWQAYGSPIPYNLILAAPYVATLAALAMFGRARAAPAALGRALSDSR